MTKPKLVKDLEHLKKLASRMEGEDAKGVECFIGWGGVRSSKHIWYFKDTKTFSIFNGIDGTNNEDFTEEDLAKFTNIIEAIERKALYLY